MRMLRLLGIVASAGAVGCNADAPSGPDYETANHTPQFYTVGGASGSTTIGIPANNSSANSFGSVAAFQIFSASQYDFVQLTVTGTVNSSDAGYCTPPVGPTGSWDPFGTSSGGFRVNFSTSPNQGGLPTGGQGTGTMTVNRGLSGSGTVTFSASRAGLVAGCSAGPGLALSGSQTIAWEIYPFFDVTASPGYVTSGDTITFTAASHWTTTGNIWKYRNDDTTSVPKGSGYPALQVCSGQGTTCKYVPTKSGRMYRVGSFPAPDGGQYGMPGPIVWVGNPPAFTLNVTARDSSVTRGDTLKFSVKNTGRGGELNAVTLSWRFQPDSVRYYDNSVSPWFKPDSVSYTVDADSVWGGGINSHIVHPGRVIVSGVSGSNTHADTIVVTVAERTWQGPEVTLFPSFYNNDRPALPDTSAMGIDSASFGRFHLVPGLNAFDGVATIGRVSGGPNDGYFYVTSANHGMPRAYSLSLWIDSLGYANYASGLTTWQWLDNIAGVDPSLFRNYTVQHEVGGVSSSHLGRHNIAGDTLRWCGNVNQAVERLVHTDSSQVAYRAESAKTRADDVIEWLSGHRWVYGHQQSPNPVAEWRSMMRPAVLDSLRDAQAASAGTQPHQDYCDGSGV